MHVGNLVKTLAFCVPFLLGPAGSPARAQEKLKPEELVARHLAAIGTDQARAAAKARQAIGSAEMRSTVGEPLGFNGQAQIVSEGRRFKIGLSFADSQYYGEQILFDGKRTDVGFSQPGQRSRLGGFLNRFPELVNEGLVGGVLTTAWPLLDLAGRQPKLQAKGLQSVDGQKLQRLEYRARNGGGEVTIVLYFDPATYRHVLTKYTYSRAQVMGTTMESSSQNKDAVYVTEERFDEFKAFDGVTLPTRWVVTYSSDTTKRTSNLAWETRIESVSHTPRIDASSFTITKR